MSYEALKLVLQAIPSSGENGFEGLVARLLGALLNESFIIARAGDQPGGDAQNVRGTIVIQAKRYSDKTSLDWREIEADIRESLRVLPRLDTFVLAVTRSATQVQPRLVAIQEETGVDIVTLQYGKDRSALAVLCVSYWNAITDFPKLDDLNTNETFRRWIQNEAADAQVRSILEAVKNEFKESLVTYNTASSIALKFLNQRFGFEPQAEPPRIDVINLSLAVPRKDMEATIRNWWVGNESPVAYIEGEEGFGKSWAAARAAHDISTATQGLVWWLSSLEWSECRSVRDVVDRALAANGVTNDAKRIRLVRKTIDVWCSPVLIVLDGANERHAINSLKAILGDLFAKRPRHLRILITTRPLEQRPEFERSLWRGCLRISATEFDEEEYKLALKRVGLTETAIPRELARIAKIPRYFQTCVRLRKRFGASENITKEVVLWVDLCDKIDSTDQQVRSALRWSTHEDAAAVLARLATGATYDASLTIASQDLLKSCFNDDYDHIRRDLEELRISDKAEKFRAVLTREHVILGWALYLHQVVQATKLSSVRDVGDLIWRTLEPMPADDLRTEAIFVALQISALHQFGFSAVKGVKQAGFLFAWTRSHNATVSQSRLEFWATEDNDVYSQFVEAFFEDLFSADHQQLIINPLGRLWRDNPTQQLREYVARWLMLVWSNDIPATQSEFNYKGHLLPVAQNDQQLRMSAVAVSLLSLRPDLELIPSLAIARATLFLSTENRHPGDRAHPWPLKSIEKNIGALMRWCYTEKILLELEELANSNQDDETLLEGLRLLAKSLSITALPTVLQLPPVDPLIHWVSAVQLIREQKSVFSGVRGDNLRASYQEIPYLAVRGDLPELSVTDYEKIKYLVEEICDSPDPVGERMLTEEELLLRNYWPWYARRYPVELSNLVGRLRLAALSRDDPYIALVRLAGAFHARQFHDQIVGESAERAKTLSADHRHAVTEMTEVILCHADVGQIMNWLRFIASVPELRICIFYHPIPVLLGIRLDNRDAKVALQRAGSVDRSLVGGSGVKDEFEFWCCIAACAGEVDDEMYKWAKDQLRSSNIRLDQYFWLFALMAATGARSAMERDLESLPLSREIQASSIRAYWIFRKSSPDKFTVGIPYEKLLQRVPQDFAGYLLRVSERLDDFDRWGCELMELVSKIVEEQPFDPNHRGKSIFQVNDNGLVEVRSYESPPQCTTFGSAASTSWGVNYGNPANFLRLMAGDFETNNDDLAAWKSDDDQLARWNHYDISDFCALSELRHWARRNRTEFVQLSTRFIQNMHRAGTSLFHMGMLTHGIIQLLVEFEPLVAFEAYSTLRNSAARRVQVQTIYGTSSVLAEYWRKDYDGSPENSQVRGQILDSVRSDAELLAVILDAFSHGSSEALRRMAESRLRMPFAKDRAFGISMLAWFGDQNAIKSLTKAKETDPSLWVRSHAEWAVEVVYQEISARALYRAALMEFEPAEFSAKLQQMKPALTPIARWWRRRIEAESSNQVSTNPHIKALRKSFWYDWEAHRPSHTVVFGRNIDEYFAGEKLDSFVTPFLAPWWNVQLY